MKRQNFDASPSPLQLHTHEFKCTAFGATKSRSVFYILFDRRHSLDAYLYSLNEIPLVRITQTNSKGHVVCQSFLLSQWLFWFMSPGRLTSNTIRTILAQCTTIISAEIITLAEYHERAIVCAFVNRILSHIAIITDIPFYQALSSHPMSSVYS